ncbi:unconventional myosin-Ig-like protein [Lates japonicus]|uniref:Unconventional myosin-Ig-like protein n=1 Tax=Lates japonicus TaxID=270547 RepID=A0AAD3MKU9_LATJO|nr:unconventional myosin-Ig-like protein [Lates japonicus]
MRAIYAIMGCYKRHKVKAHLEVERRFATKSVIMTMERQVRDCPQTSSGFIRVSKELRNKDQYSQVLFSGFCRKVNRFNKSTDRGVLVTDKYVYKLEPKKQYKVLKKLPLDAFTGVTVTSGVDQMVALHTSSQDDVLLCLQRGELCPNQDRVGELVGSLVDHFTRHRNGQSATLSSFRDKAVTMMWL